MVKIKGTHSVKNLPNDFDKIKDEYLDRIKIVVKNSQYTRIGIRKGQTMPQKTTGPCN